MPDYGKTGSTQSFKAPGKVLDALSLGDVAEITSTASDVALILDDDGTIIDATAADNFPDLKKWRGKEWIETVTVESRPKVEEMLAPANGGGPQRWRQVNHQSDNGDIPVRYRIVDVGNKNRKIAIGRDMRDSAILQQRLLQAQQSLERDYMRLRNTETRYRLLFEMAAEPTLIVAAEGQRIREANPAAHSFFDKKPGSLPGKSLSALFGRSTRDDIATFLGAALNATSPASLTLDHPKSKGEAHLSASAFRQEGEHYFLVRLANNDEVTPRSIGTRKLLEVIERMPDAFVVADANMTIVAANEAFLDVTHTASVEKLLGKPLGDYLGRPGIDLDLIQNQLSKDGLVRNVGTVLRAGLDADEEEVELSAVAVSNTVDHYGFSIRMIGRRLRDLPPVHQDLPRSVEQLTELVGRMSLKDIVRESTDLIERLCIEAALAYTADNRASAAEILGLSRQSLYSKLHRYGLGNLVSEPD